MPTKQGSGGTADPAAVDAFFATLGHPHREALLALRRIILGVDPGISEGIKWNVPSFRTTEWFATLHPRAKQGVQVILHFGAKKRADPTEGTGIADPESLLEWLGSDRAVAKFRDAADVEAKGAAFAALIREWIRRV